MGGTDNGGNGKTEQRSLFRDKHWHDHDLIRDQLWPPSKSKGKLLLWILVSRMGANRQTWDAQIDELANAINCVESTLRDLIATLKRERLLTAEPISGKPRWYRFRVCRSNLPDFVPEHSEIRSEHSEIRNHTSYEQQLNTNVNTNGGAAEIPPELDSDEFREAWSRWGTYRREVRRKPISELAACQQFKKLAAVGVRAAIAAIDNAIANDWQGLFPDKSANAAQHSGLKAWAAEQEDLDQ